MAFTDFFKKLFGKKKESTEDSRELVKETALHQLELFEKKGLERKTASDEFFNLFRKIMANLLHLKNQFTYEELVAQLDKKRVNSQAKEALSELCKKITDAEYGVEKPSAKELKELLEETKKIVNML